MCIRDSSEVIWHVVRPLSNESFTMTSGHDSHRFTAKHVTSQETDSTAELEIQGTYRGYQVQCMAEASFYQKSQLSATRYPRGTPISPSGTLRSLRIFKILWGLLSLRISKWRRLQSLRIFKIEGILTYFYILSCKITVSNSKVQVLLKTASFNTFG